MAVADLGLLAALGIWLEILDRRLAASAIAFGALATGFGLHFFAPEVVRFRGASGIASALFVAGILEIAALPAGRARRALALAGLALFLAKVGWEAATGRPLASGALPGGGDVLAAGHLFGAAAGAASWAAVRTRWGEATVTPPSREERTG